MKTSGTQQAFYNVEELAKITSETPAAWRKRIFKKQIGYVKFGKNVRVSRAEFERWVEAGTVAAVPEEPKVGRRRGSDALDWEPIMGEFEKIREQMPKIYE
jgi:excisionase family DNA binding protein